MKHKVYTPLKQRQQAQQAQHAAIRKACIEFMQGLIIALAFFGFALLAGLWYSR